MNSKGVLIVGFYKVDGKMIAKDAGFEIADVITKINNIEVNSINDMQEVIKQEKNNKIVFTIIRNKK